MMITEAQQRQHKRDATAAAHTEARSEVGRIIIKMFLNSENLWATSAEILDACSEYDKVLVRNRIQLLAGNKTLEADKSGGIRNYKYRLQNVSVHAASHSDFVGPLQLAEPSVTMTTPMATSMVLPEPIQIAEGVNGRKHKVVWSDDERMVLAHEVATIREKQKFINLGTALEMAQRACLPGERHRIPITHVKSQAPWLVDMVDLIARNKSVEIIEPVAPTVTPADFTVGQLIDALLDKLSDRFKGGVIEILNSSEVRSMLHTNYSPPAPIPRHNPHGVPMEPTIKLERILIAGLLKPSHIEEVKDKFGATFDLRFYHPDQSTHQLKNAAPNADRVILMANMVSHKHEDALRATNVKYEKIRGNIGVLMSRLTELKAAH